VDRGVVVWWQYAEGGARARAGALLRVAAAEFAGVRPSRVRIGRAASGAPVPAGAAEGLLASVSHTRGLVAVAVCAPHAVSGVSGVGVDAEAVRPLDAVALAGRWFAPDEAAWVRSLPRPLRNRALLHLWTRKESAGKALGVGLAGGGMRRPVGHPPPGVRPAPSGRLVPLPGSRELLGAVLPGPSGHVLACAVRGAAAAPPVVHVVHVVERRTPS
jgi:4'-phosphopantetheinyl transferase